MSTTCEAPDCLRPARHGIYCDTHGKRARQGRPLAAPIPPTNQTPRERFFEACLRFAAADSDDEYQKAEWVLMKAGIRYFKRANVGRPPTVDASKAAEMFRHLQSVRAVARSLGTSRQSVRRALGRAGVRKFRPRDDVRDPGEG